MMSLGTTPCVGERNSGEGSKVDKAEAAPGLRLELLLLALRQGDKRQLPLSQGVKLPGCD